ncbi:hypothetical protein [Guptibacillus algicola]|uniref:hypothetical protein n=1 Tax=Guptibacillus algicola TaxID=225844 RepID=UPI001CD81A31|nr:hypothetical protein [Alkalihalobacillus algicola]MCA0989112.1 hypothetical protein [Alkalihalobacillus algicola]
METTEMITRIQDTFKNWVGGHLIIEKIENEDVDKTIMLLEGITFLQNGEQIDHYTDSTLLQLQGEGKIISEEDTVPLPHSSFDIQLEGLMNINQVEDGLTITTERANYTITYNSN